MFKKLLRLSRMMSRGIVEVLFYHKSETVNPIIIYQMGKVGSMTVYSSVLVALRKNKLRVPVHHAHNLNNLDIVERDVLSHTERPNPAATLGNIKEGKKLLKKIVKNPGQRWNLISLVRDPVAQNVGAFFHNMHEFFPNWRKDFDNGILTIANLQEYFIKKYSHKASTVWFEQQMEPVWGINVYATPFPREVGYKIYHGPKADLLLIRLEDLDRIGTKALKKFLGIHGIKIIKKNVADEKDYRDIYMEFKKRPFPISFIDDMYNSKFMVHFYSRDECNVFRRYWSGG
jgi:hypothetical protein